VAVYSSLSCPYVDQHGLVVNRYQGGHLPQTYCTR